MRRKVAIVAVPGLPSEYRCIVYDLGRERKTRLVESRFSFVTKAVERIKSGDRVGILLLLPHSLVLQGLKRAPHAIKDEICLRDEFREELEELVRKDLKENLGNEENFTISSSYVQIRFVITLKDEGEVTSYDFRGNLAHAFVQTFRELEKLDSSGEKGLDEILFDTSIGWNNLMAQAMLGTMTYAIMKWGPEWTDKVTFFASEPVGRTSPFVECRNPGDRRSTGGGTVGTPRPGLILRPATLMETPEIADVMEMMIKIFLIDEAVFKTHVIEEIHSLKERIEEELVSIMGEEGVEYAKEVVKLLLQARKVFCGLESHIVPYLHYSLKGFVRILRGDKIVSLTERLRRMLDEEDFVRATWDVRRALGKDVWEVKVSYRSGGVAPLTYVLLSGLENLLANMRLEDYNNVYESLTRDLGSDMIDAFPPEFVDWLRDYYRRNNMLSHLSLLYSELYRIPSIPLPEKTSFRYILESLKGKLRTGRSGGKKGKNNKKSKQDFPRALDALLETWEQYLEGDSRWNKLTKCVRGDQIKKKALKNLDIKKARRLVAKMWPPYFVCAWNPERCSEYFVKIEGKDVEYPKKLCVKEFEDLWKDLRDLIAHVGFGHYILFPLGRNNEFFDLKSHDIEPPDYIQYSKTAMLAAEERVMIEVLREGRGSDRFRKHVRELGRYLGDFNVLSICDLPQL